MPRKSYSQRKRESFDYRTEYFRHNPGLFGCLWSCAYCHRILIGKKNVQVDHIMPLNSMLGRNAGYNLVAACERCNKRKSDTMDSRVAVGYFSKILEVIVFTVQKVVVIGFAAVYSVLHTIAGFAFSLITKPFIGTSITMKIIFLCLYLGAGYWVISSI